MKRGEQGLPAGGNGADGYTYDMFGAIRSQSGTSDNAWPFTGQQRDDVSGTKLSGQ